MTMDSRFAALGAALLLAGCSAPMPTAVKVELAPSPGDGRPPLLNFSMATLDGKTWQLADAPGKVTVLNFWATWCGPCRAEMPGLVAASKAYASKGVRFAGITTDEDPKTAVPPYLKQQPIPYPILLPKPGDPLVASLPGVPVTLVLDRQNRIAKKWVGAVPEPVLRAELDRVLAE